MNAYGDIGIVVGIEGGDSSHAVAEVEFNNCTETGTVKFPVKDLAGLGPLTIDSCVHAEFVDEYDQNPVAKAVTYMTDEEMDEVLSWADTNIFEK